MDTEKLSLNFIDELVEEDVKEGKNLGRVQTRVPPEPNGYLHIGHAKSICLNFGIAKKHNGTCGLYFDDTNPNKEKDEYVKAIQEDIKWLGFEWDKLYFASEHYEKLYEIACKFISDGKAYVCNLTAEQVRDYRGTLNEPGKNSPYRDRSIEENLEIFKRMREGEFPDGYCTLRAKIDMSSPNLNMRDPVIYRIMRATHYRTGDKWCIYPMYDFASPLVDALEGVTHSLCGMEFEDHRPLYDWIVNELGYFKEPPRQIEFARLNLTRTLLGKRFIKKLVEEKIVSGWDDPRMATLCGMRRRGYPPAAIRRFMNTIGVAKAISTVDFALLEHCVREELESDAERRMVVTKPIKLCIDNYPEDKVEYANIENHPGNLEMGLRKVPFTRELYIEEEDFSENPPPKYFRLREGALVRLKGAYVVKCTGATRSANGETIVHGEIDLDKEIGIDKQKVKGTIHWISSKFAVPVEIRQYDFLLNECDTDITDYTECINPASLEVLNGFAEPALKEQVNVGDRFQFVRSGYYCLDKDSTDEKKVFNQIVSLKDRWNKKRHRIKY